MKKSQMSFEASSLRLDSSLTLAHVRKNIAVEATGLAHRANSKTIREVVKADRTFAGTAPKERMLCLPAFLK
jgi:hypothetical protein